MNLYQIHYVRESDGRSVADIKAFKTKELAESDLIQNGYIKESDYSFKQ